MVGRQPRRAVRSATPSHSTVSYAPVSPRNCAMSASMVGSSMTQRSTILPSLTTTNSWPSNVKRLPVGGRSRQGPVWVWAARQRAARRSPSDTTRGFQPFGLGRPSSPRGGTLSAFRCFLAGADRDRRNRPSRCRRSCQALSAHRVAVKDLPVVDGSLSFCQRLR
jgi:hypothetical protein